MEEIKYVNKYAHIETPVGAGFYALRKTRYSAKLVRRDRGTPMVFKKGFATPHTGHNERRQRIIDKRARNV